eukprot:m.188369 g.188369  ORF g.188369 m.188369 type:complete len:50 (+) comp16936_c0_seq53:636-785(+)
MVKCCFVCDIIQSLGKNTTTQMKIECIITCMYSKLHPRPLDKATNHTHP